MLGMTDEQELLGKGKLIHTNERNGAPLLLLDGVAVKFFPRRSPLVHLMRVACKGTKAHKQWNAASALRKIGLQTPEPVEVKVFGFQGDYEAAYLYRFLENAKPLHQALLDGDRPLLLSTLAEELALMAQSGFLFVDFHLGNVLVDELGKLWWIDPEMTFSAAEIRKKFWSRMERMHHKCDPGVLSDDEWSFFVRMLNEKLPEDLKRI